MTVDHNPSGKQPKRHNSSTSQQGVHAVGSSQVLQRPPVAETPRASTATPRAPYRPAPPPPYNCWLRPPRFVSNQPRANEMPQPPTGPQQMLPPQAAPLPPAHQQNVATQPSPIQHNFLLPILPQQLVAPSLNASRPQLPPPQQNILPDAPPALPVAPFPAGLPSANIALVRRPPLTPSDCPALRSQISHKVFVCGVAPEVSRAQLLALLGTYGPVELTLYRTEESSAPEHASHCLGNCYHILFLVESKLKQFISHCTYHCTTGGYFFPISFAGQRQLWIQVVPWHQYDKVWLGEKTYSMDDSKIATISNICGNLSATKLAQHIMSAFGEVGVCLVHINNKNCPDFYPTGKGFVVFVCASDCVHAIHTEKLRVHNGTHSSTLYITPHVALDKGAERAVADSKPPQ